MRKKIHKNLFGITVFSIGLLIMLYNLYQLPVIKHKLPIIDRYIQAYKYQQTAKSFSPSSIMAKRLYAIADALRHNRTNYSFTAGQLPPMAGK
jgi:hypothetical protein